MTHPPLITVVSGAAKGIGRACTERLVADGHEVIGLGRSKPTDNFPGQFLVVDFSNRQDVLRISKEISDNVAVNGVVNNVGDPGPQLLEEIDLDAVDKVMEVNFYSAIQLVKAFMPTMKSQRYGRIVNISSELALGLATRTAYGAAKAAMISAVRTWSLELASVGITANAVAPGPVDTELFNQNNPLGSDIRQQKESKIPMGRIATAEDIAQAVSFFMAPATAYVTGQTLFVDGGSSLGAKGLL